MGEGEIGEMVKRSSGYRPEHYSVGILYTIYITPSTLPNSATKLQPTPSPHLPLSASLPSSSHRTPYQISLRFFIIYIPMSNQHDNQPSSCGCRDPLQFQASVQASEIRRIVHCNNIAYIIAMLTYNGTLCADPFKHE
jgi:hypothetical protein